MFLSCLISIEDEPSSLEFLSAFAGLCSHLKILTLALYVLRELVDD